MKVKTTVMDRAAFLMCYGAKLTEIGGKVPDNDWTLEVEPSIVNLEKTSGMVHYKRFCNMRKKLKGLSRKQQGLPIHYMSKSNRGNLLKDVARFVPWGARDRYKSVLPVAKS